MGGIMVSRYVCLTGKQMSADTARDDPDTSIFLVGRACPVHLASAEPSPVAAGADGSGVLCRCFGSRSWNQVALWTGAGSSSIEQTFL